MSVVSFVPKRDGFIQYIDKVLAKKSTNSEAMEIADRTEKDNYLQLHHRVRRDALSDKNEMCKGLQIASAVTEAAAGVASSMSTAAASVPFFGTPGASAAALIASGQCLAKMGVDIAYIEKDCDSIPFDEIKEIMDKRFNNLDKAVDRNYEALKEVSKLVSKTLTAVEQTRMEMHYGFNEILTSIKNSRIEPLLSTVDNFIRYFDVEKDRINSLPRDIYIDQIDETNNILNYLKDSRTPKDDSLYTLLNDIINQKFAIPSHSDDIINLSALYSLHYGAQTFVSVLLFMIEQHSYLADYHFKNGELGLFNDHFGEIQNIFQQFRYTLVGSTNNHALIPKIMKITEQVQDIDFIADDRMLSETLSEKYAKLKKLKDEILEMTLPVIEDTPAKFTGRIEFKEPYITTPFGEWQNGQQVYYAIQYKDGNKYSKVGPWSEPLTVHVQANPTLRIPVDPKGRTRLIYRKFHNSNPVLVGTIDDINQDVYRDINRDLYNVVSSPDRDFAQGVVDILLNNNAHPNAIFDQGRQALHSAAKDGNPWIAINMLKPSDINIRDDNGYTPLHIAAEAGHDDMIIKLIENHANVNAQTFGDELTPIHLAAHKGYVSTVEIIMKSQGINMNLGDNEGFTPLHSAVAGGPLVVQTILSHPSVDINQKSNTGLTALHLAAINNYRNIAEVLLNTKSSRKLNINIEANGKMTPLHFATISGHLEIVQLLLNAGANINVQSATNFTPLHFAASLNKLDIALVLLQSSDINLNLKTEDGITPMHIACATGQIEIVQKILEKSPSNIVEILSAKTKEGLTPLHIATMNKHMNVIRLLIDNDAGIEARTNQGLTPLLVAVVGGKLDIFKYLRNNNAHISAVDDNNNTALHLAVQSGHLDIVKYLVDDERFGLEAGHSLLLSAIKKGHLKIIEYLVDYNGVDPTSTCDRLAYPSCALSAASKYGNLDIFRYIESKFTNVDLSGVPLQNAVRYGHLSLVKYMIEKRGAEPNRWENGESAMHLAIKYGWLSIVKYLHETRRVDLDFGKDTYNNNYIQLAIASGNLFLVKYLLESIRGPITWEDPLHFAVRGPNFESLNDKQSSSVLRYLIDEKHVAVNAQAQYGYTALHEAVRYESLYAIKFLISRGALLDLKSTSYETPLDLAVKYNKRAEIQDLLKIQDTCIALSYGEDPGLNQNFNVNTVCVDVNKRFMDDIYHTTALHLAASAGARNTFQQLINHGANVNARDDEGNVPLHYAVQKGNVEFINILIKSGADINLANLKNQTPKDLAKENHATDIVEILMQAQMDQNAGNLTRVKKSINQKSSLVAESSSKANDNVLTYIIEKVCGKSDATPLCLQSSSGNQQESIDVRGAQCLNSNVSLGLLLAQNFLNKKFPLPNFSHVTTGEARAMALTISNKFEKLLKKHTKAADDLDFYQLYKDIEANIQNEKFMNVPNVLLEFAKKACGKDVDNVAGEIATMFPKL